MKRFLWIIGIGLGILAALVLAFVVGGGMQRLGTLVPEETVIEQARAATQQELVRIYDQPPPIERRPLDFTPFSQALAAFSATRASELDQLLANASISQIQELLSQGQLTSEELTTYYLRRIQRFDENKLNSIIDLNPEALIIARQLDDERRAGKVRGPLHGIPVTLKDTICTGDQMRITMGALALQDARCDRDALLAARLREAGAILLGKNNLSEWAGYMSDDLPGGFSSVGGQTRNPYGRFRTLGSSSGSAVAVAANFAAAAIGTETTGSIVAPAGQNSVFGMKPSVGLISRDRTVSLTLAQDSPGPLTRSVTDLALLLTILSNTDRSDPQTLEAQTLAGTDFTTFLDPNGLDGLRIGLLWPSVEEQPGDEALLDQVVRNLRSAGATVVKITAPRRIELATLADDETAIKYDLKGRFGEFTQAISTTSSIKTLADIIAFNQQDLAKRAPYGQARLESAANSNVSRSTYRRQIAENRDYSRTLVRGFIEDNQLDLLLTVHNSFSAGYAPGGLPALCMPVGYRASGEPFGLTWVGDYLADGALIRAAYAYEQQFPVRRAPELR